MSYQTHFQMQSMWRWPLDKLSRKSYSSHRESAKAQQKLCIGTVLPESSWFAYTIWAAIWQNQQSECAPSKDSDQPGHPPSLMRVFTVHMKKPWVLSYPLSAQWRLWSDWADAQADLSLCRVHSHFVGFVMSWLIYGTRGAIPLTLLYGCVHTLEGLQTAQS